MKKKAPVYLKDCYRLSPDAVIRLDPDKDPTMLVFCVNSGKIYQIYGRAFDFINALNTKVTLGEVMKKLKIPEDEKDPTFQKAIGFVEEACSLGIIELHKGNATLPRFNKNSLKLKTKPPKSSKGGFGGIRALNTYTPLIEPIMVEAYTSSSCFGTGALIWMADETQRPIEELKKGDAILSYDELRRKTLPSRVLRVSRHEGQNDKCYEITLMNGNLITVTENHSLYIFEESRYIDVGQIYELNQGKRTMSLVSPRGDVQKIVQVKPGMAAACTFNLEIEGFPDSGQKKSKEKFTPGQNYFVGGVLAAD